MDSFLETDFPEVKTSVKPGMERYEAPEPLRSSSSRHSLGQQVWQTRSLLIFGYRIVDAQFSPSYPTDCGEAANQRTKGLVNQAR